MKPPRPPLESMAVILSKKAAFCSDCILLILFILILIFLPCLFHNVIVTLILRQTTVSHGDWTGSVSSFLLQEVVCTVQCQGHYYLVIYYILYFLWIIMLIASLCRKLLQAVYGWLQNWRKILEKPDK